MTLANKLQTYLHNNPDFQAIFEHTRHSFNAKSQLTAHNFEHAYRDTLNAIRIGEAEKADMEVVLPAAVMHDIGFLYGATGRTHAAIGAEKLEQFLEEGGIHLSESKRQAIADCIRT